MNRRYQAQVGLLLDVLSIIGFNEGEPDWNLLSFPNARSLPAVRWKQVNLDIMDRGKRNETTRKLEQVFKNNLKQ